MDEATDESTRDPADGRPSAGGTVDAIALAAQAALAARAASGMEHEGWEAPQRHAFATLLFGLASAAAATGDAEAVSDLATTLLRQALRLGFREATSLVDAIVDGLTADPPHPGVRQLVAIGRGAMEAHRAGDDDAFAALVVQATSSDAFASDRPLLPVRPPRTG